MNGPRVLTLPNHGQLSVHEGMRLSLEGKQASGAGESHAQDANVAEVSYGKAGYWRTRVSSNWLQVFPMALTY